MDISKHSSRVVYENRWMKVREDEIERRDGSRGIFGVVEKQDFVLVIPSDDTGLYLVQQYRYPVGGRFWEFPQGAWEQAPDADPADVARGELLEETGLVPKTLDYLGHLFEAYGYSTQGFYVFHATDLVVAHEQRSVEEQSLVRRHVEFGEFEDMVRAGEIKDAPSVAALTLLRLHGSGRSVRR